MPTPFTLAPLVAIRIMGAGDLEGALRLGALEIGAVD